MIGKLSVRRLKRRKIGTQQKFDAIFNTNEHGYVI